MPPSIVKDLWWRVTEKHFRNDIDRADPSFWHRDGQDDPLRSLLPLWVCDAQFLSRACTKANKQPCTWCRTLVALKQSQISGEAVLCTIFSLWLMHVFFGAFFSQKVSILVLQNFSACGITLVLFPLHFLPEDYSSQGQLTFSLEFNWLTFLLPGAALMIEFDKSRTVSKPVFVNFSV